MCLVISCLSVRLSPVHTHTHTHTYRGVPCLCLCSWGQLLIAGLANGLIRLYSVHTGKKMVEIAAHARCISALDVAQDAGLVRLGAIIICYSEKVVLDYA